MFNHLERDLSEDDMLGNMARLFCGLALCINRRNSESSDSPFKHLHLKVACVNALYCRHIAVGEALLPVPTIRSFLRHSSSKISLGSKSRLVAQPQQHSKIYLRHDFV